MIPTLSDFSGTWIITREIADALGAQTAHLDGEAVFSLSPSPETETETEAGGNPMHLNERGLLRFPGQPPIRAVREYLWRQDGARIAVAFSDGRAFHSFDPAAVPCSARHDCPPDLYLVSYAFADWPRWRTEWRVRGPRKDYVMRTLYTR